MAHTTTDTDKEKLLNRVSRIKGQVNAIEKALEGGDSTSSIRAANRPSRRPKSRKNWGRLSDELLGNRSGIRVQQFG